MVHRRLDPQKNSSPGTCHCLGQDAADTRQQGVSQCTTVQQGCYRSVTRKPDVIHNTSSTQHTAMPQARQHAQNIIGAVWTCGS